MLKLRYERKRLSKVQVAIRFDQQMLEKIDSRKNDFDCSRSELIREALYHFFATYDFTQSNGLAQPIVEICDEE